MLFCLNFKILRGRFKIKNTIICGKSPKGGGGVRAKIKKVYISNVDSLWLRGGGLNFSDFSQIQITEIWPSLRACCLPYMPAAFLDFNDIWDCYWWDICNIRYIYGLYMNKIFPIISLIWFRNGFSKVQRGCNDIKIVYISNFSQFRSRGGVIENQFFPKFKKVQIILGGGGKKIMDFFHNLWHFLFWTVPLDVLINFVLLKKKCTSKLATLSVLFNVFSFGKWPPFLSEISNFSFRTLP